MGSIPVGATFKPIHGDGWKELFERLQVKNLEAFL